jgi:cytochrome c peroxidase
MVIHTGWKHRSWIVIALLICGAVSAQESSRAGGARRLSLPESPHQYSEMGIPALRGRNVRQRGRFGRRSDNTPGDNPITDLGATLGRVLFYDTRLSVDGTVSCASCHLQKNAFADPRRVSVGIEGREGKRNAPSLVNARYNSNGRFFWDERAGSLEEQVLMPIQDPAEMGFELEDLVERLDSIPEYRELFAGAFGATDVTEDGISKALAQFVRSLVSYRSRFDEGLAQAGAVARRATRTGAADGDGVGKPIPSCLLRGRLRTTVSMPKWEATTVSVTSPDETGTMGGSRRRRCAAWG